MGEMIECSDVLRIVAKEEAMADLRLKIEEEGKKVLQGLIERCRNCHTKIRKKIMEGCKEVTGGYEYIKF
jgi:hypothetical protein